MDPGVMGSYASIWTQWAVDIHSELTYLYNLIRIDAQEKTWIEE